jgi:hypothetical protein
MQALKCWAAGLVTLLVASLVAGVGLLAVLPDRPPSALAHRLPLLLAAAAFGGRVDLTGSVAGHISVLNSGGLLGQPAGTGGPSHQLTIIFMPVTITLLCAVALGFAIRRVGGLDRVPAALVIVGFAVAGFAIAWAGRAELAGGTVRAGLVLTPIGAAALAALTILATWFLGSPHPVAVAAGRAAGSVAKVLLLVGIPAIVIVAAFWGFGVIGTLLVGGPLPTGLALTLLLLLAPAVLWEVVGLGLGMPFHASGRVLGIEVDRTLTVVGLAHGLPLLAFLPVAAAAILLVATTRAARPSNLAGLLIAFGGIGLLVYGCGRVGLVPDWPGGERVGLDPVWWAALALPLLWALVLGALAPRVAGLVGDRS